jgi:cytochrome c-type biogenesis protein CcmH
MSKRLVRMFQAGALLAAGLFFCLSPAPAQQDLFARERALQDRFMATCCWSETIAHHRSETALEQRVELRRLLEEGKSDREIVDWFKAKYGARVLVEPEGRLSLTAYALPAVAAILGVVLVILLIRRWARPHPAATH